MPGLIVSSGLSGCSDCSGCPGFSGLSGCSDCFSITVIIIVIDDLLPFLSVTSYVNSYSPAFDVSTSPLTTILSVILPSSKSIALTPSNLLNCSPTNIVVLNPSINISGAWLEILFNIFFNSCAFSKLLSIFIVIYKSLEDLKLNNLFFCWSFILYTVQSYYKYF